MKLYEPRSCCICFDTKSGSLVLAYLSLKTSILLILSALSGHLAHGVQVVLEQDPALDHQQRENIRWYVCSYLIIWCILLGPCSCLLIHGIRKNCPGLMLPYLVLQRFIIAIKIILVVLLAGLMIINGIMIGPRPRHHVVVVIAVIIIIIKQIYFNLVINAYYKQVKRALSQDHSILAEELDIDGSGCKVKV